MNTINDRIKYLRKNEKLTQKDFAHHLLISQSYLSGVENGNEIPTNKLLKLICLEFGVNESWLIDGIGEVYDEVNENDKASLAEISNSALLKIMTLLSTQSNVEYGFFAVSLEAFTNILQKGLLLKESSKLEYLKTTQNLMLDLDRMLSAAHDEQTHSLMQHKKTLYEDIEILLKCNSRISK